MSATLAPVIHSSPARRFPGLAIPVLLIAAAIISTVWIHRGDSIVAEDTAVEPSPSAMF
ncbi:MAG: hypothetical protein ACXWF6_07275 [Usitatibacter sp.]